jgi:hypothetical protein
VEYGYGEKQFAVFPHNGQMSRFVAEISDLFLRAAKYECLSSFWEALIFRADCLSRKAKERRVSGESYGFTSNSASNASARPAIQRKSNRHRCCICNLIQNGFPLSV